MIGCPEHKHCKNLPNTNLYRLPPAAFPPYLSPEGSATPCSQGAIRCCSSKTRRSSSTCAHFRPRDHVMGIMSIMISTMCHFCNEKSACGHLLDLTHFRNIAAVLAATRIDQPGIFYLKHVIILTGTCCWIRWKYSTTYRFQQSNDIWCIMIYIYIYHIYHICHVYASLHSVNYFTKPFWTPKNESRKPGKNRTPLHLGFAHLTHQIAT